MYQRLVTIVMTSYNKVRHELADKKQSVQNKEWYGKLTESAFAKTVKNTLKTASSSNAVSSLKSSVC